MKRKPAPCPKCGWPMDEPAYLPHVCRAPRIIRRKPKLAHERGCRIVPALDLAAKVGRFRGWTTVAWLPNRDAYLMRGPARFYRKRHPRMAGK